TRRHGATYFVGGGYEVRRGFVGGGEQAGTLGPPPADRGSTRLLGVAFCLGILALLAAPALNALAFGEVGYGSVVGWIGVAVMVGGLALRLWSPAVLGRYYTSTLRHPEDQPILG